MLETEFALTPANLQVFARVGNGRVPIKQDNNFAFNGVDRIDFEDADSTLHFFFPEDVAYALADSANRINVTRVFSSQRGKDYVLVGVPFSWIDAAPKGKLIIDPTTTVATSEDVWLETASNFDGHSAGLLVGKVAGGSKKRTIIKFNIAGSGVPSSATVLNAQMKMYYYGTGGSGWVDRWLQAHQILVNWAEAQATSVNRLTGTAWNVAHVGLNDIDAKSSYESTLFFYLVGGQQVYGWKSWDLTALTQKWVSGTATNYGVVLWATNETTDGKDLRFYSSEAVAPNDVNRPYLEVIYSQQAKTVYFLKDHLGSIRATVQDTVGAPVRGYDDYDPWGYILAGRSLGNSVLPVATRNRFTGKERDDEFGVNWDYFGARYYDAQIGRFFNVDRFAEKYPALTPYQYAANNPLLFVDVNGDSINLTALRRADQALNTNATGATLSDLQTQTGLSLSVNEQGMLVYATDSEGNPIVATDSEGNQIGSAEARSLLTGAIGAKDVVEVSMTYGQGSKGTDLLVGIDPKQVDSFIQGTSSGLDSRTLGYGMVFMHELQHTKIGGALKDPGKIFGRIGAVEDRMNIIRSQLGPNYGQRLSYAAQELNGSKWLPFDQAALNQLKKNLQPATRFIKH